jgi:hypothetical protein
VPHASEYKDVNNEVSKIIDRVKLKRQSREKTGDEKYSYTSRNIKWQSHCIKYNITHSNAFIYNILGAKKFTI